MGFFDKFKARKVVELVSPVDGKLLLTGEIKDETFSQNMLGETLAVYPSDGTIVSPIDGVIEMMYPTGHAFSVKHKSGFNVLVHIGIDTVTLKPVQGQPAIFNQLLKAGAKVNAGQSIIETDFQAILKNKLDPSVMIVLIDDDSLEGKKLAVKLNPQDVKSGQKIAEII